MSDVLHFRASTNVKNLIGKDLVTDELTAVFELVKNSYDADANKVVIEFQDLLTGNGTLIIRDNGTGMDLFDIENKWMVIGTDSKKNKQFSEKYERPLNGDKGIGRFSVDRLGEKLLFTSVKENINKKITMKFDWTEFENEYKDLEQISVPYAIVNENNIKQGVTLEISKLRDKWDKTNINKLINNLRIFKSPFNIDDNFKLIVNVPEYDIHDKEILPFNLENISSLWVNVEVPIENTSEISITIVKDGIKYFENYKNTYTFGPVKAKIYFFNKGDKLSFKNRMKTTVKGFGNIRLYRDGFRIYPYGESYNDWLDIDMRHAQGYSRTFGVRDLIGYVQIYKEHNTGIDAPTNRQGIIDSEHAKQLRDFIIDYPIKILEKFFFDFKKSKNETFEKSKREVENAVDELKKVEKDIRKTSPSAAKLLRQVTEVVSKSQGEQNAFVKNQEELIKVYKRVASKEVLLHRIIHQALINIDAAKSASLNLKDTLKDQVFNNNFSETILSEIDNIDKPINNAWDILLKARDNLIQTKEKIHLNILNSIKNLVNSFSHKLSENQINVDIRGDDSITYYIDKNDFNTITENFISNSIKSLLQVQNRQRKMSILVNKTEKYLIINYKDNGIGVPEHLRERIFDHFFSTTGSFGMGLSIVDEIVKEYSGELYLVENNESGAEFQVKLRR